MSDQPIPLMPDDEQPNAVLFEDDRPEVWQPYGYVAVYAGLLLLLLLRFLVPVLEKYDGNYLLPVWLRANLALIAVLGCYLILTLLRPRVYLLGLCIAGAILGLWFGMPAELLYQDAWHSAKDFASLFSLTVFAGVSGLLLGRFLVVEREPKLVIPISFLFVFVSASIYSLVYPFIPR